MVDYNKVSGKATGAGVMGGNTISDEATIHLQIENIFKDEMAFDGDIDRILDTLRNHIGNPAGIVHDGCFYYIDTGKFSLPIQTFDDWYNAFIREQEDEIMRRRQSKGFPKDCTDIYADDFTSSFYGCSVASAFGVHTNIDDMANNKNDVNSQIALQFRLNKSYRKSEIQKAVNRQVDIFTRRGKLGKPVQAKLNGIFTDMTIERPDGSGISTFWIHTTGLPSCEWLSEMAHVGLEKKLDIDDLTLRAWPNTNWNRSLSPGSSNDLPYDFR